MRTEDFEKLIEAKGLTPIEVVISPQGEVRWFAAIAEKANEMVLFDSQGYAYTSPTVPNATDFVFAGETPKYHGNPMTFEPKLNLIF